MSTDQPAAIVSLPPAFAAVLEEMTAAAEAKHRESADLRYRVSNLLREFLGVDTATRLTYLRDDRAVQVHQPPANSEHAATET
jgi:hypothetical protein